MSNNLQGLTSYDIQPGPFSELELREQWNAQANEYYQWADLALCQQLAWAQTRAIAADRAQGAPRDMPPAVDVTEQATTIRYEFEVFNEHVHTVACGDAATLEEAEREGRHYLARYQQNGSCTLELRRVDVLSVSDSQPAPSPAEPPLWRVMVRAYNNAPELPDGIKDREMWAAEIVAARNWLKRRLPEGGAWYVLLTTEADRAERGE